MTEEICSLTPTHNHPDRKSNRPPAYIWSYEFSRERMKLVEALRNVWEVLFDEQPDSGHYAPYQWIGSSDQGMSTQRFEGQFDGMACEINLRVITTRDWYARKVQMKALAQLRERYPNWDSHGFEDGTRIGERILNFDSEEYGLARFFLLSDLDAITSNPEFTVSEALFIAPLDALDNVGSEEGKLPRRRITLIRHLDTIDAVEVEALVKELKNGVLPEVAPGVFQFNDDNFLDGFVCLSNSELVALNWADARKPHDAALREAVNRADYDAVSSALDAGADPNQLDEFNASLVFVAISGNSQIFYDPTERPPKDKILRVLRLLLQRGAHPDLHFFDMPSPLTLAVWYCDDEVVSLLLKYGASASIVTFFDTPTIEWPSAWDGAYTKMFLEQDSDAIGVWRALVMLRPSPFVSQEREEKERAEFCLGG